MANIFSAAKKLFNSSEVGTPKQGCISEDISASDKPVVSMPITIHCTLFFDGTGNNKINSKAREIEDEIAQLDERKKELEKAGNVEEAKKIKAQREKIEEDSHFNPSASEEDKEEHNKLLISREVYLDLKRKDKLLDDSHMNDCSNVAILWRELMEKDNDKYKEGEVSFRKLYIEGIGTSSTDEDDMMSSGVGQGWNPLGSGGYGVIGKVNIGLKQLISNVKIEIDNMYSLLKKNNPDFIVKISNIHIGVNVFGFSRGAAAARHFIYPLLNSTSYIPFTEGYHTLEQYVQIFSREKGYGESSTTVKVNYAGLFDTVATFGILNTKFEWGSEDALRNFHSLHLDAIKDADAVTHICALDEYRQNFALTDISSSGGKGEQFYLPGAHSDIGGGYPKKMTENAWVARKIFHITGQDPKDKDYAKDDKDWLLNEGWVEEKSMSDEMTVTPNIYANYTDEGLVQEYVEVNIYLKRTLVNSYSKIPLNLMATKANKANPDVLKFRTTFLEKGDCSTVGLPDELQKIYELAKANPKSSFQEAKVFWGFETKDIVKKVRNKYLHFSASHRDASIIEAFQLNPVKLGRKLLKVASHKVDPYKPRLEGGIRVRKIHKG